MQREPKKLTFDEAQKKIDDRHKYIINGVECDIRIYLHSKDNYSSILCDSFEVVYSDLRKSFRTTFHKLNMLILKNYFSNNQIIEIFEKSSNEIGVYELTNYCGRDGNIKFLKGKDILKYKEKLDSHISFLNESSLKYKELNFNNAIEITETNSSRLYNELEKTIQDIKEFHIHDISYFNYIIKTHSKFPFTIIREMGGSCSASIYQNAVIFNYDIEKQSIIFEFSYSNMFHIHKDLNINPFLDYKKHQRIKKISKLLK